MDQDPFVRLTRDVASKIGLKKPGDLISNFCQVYLEGVKCLHQMKILLYILQIQKNKLKRKLKGHFLEEKNS